ncbi:MAG: MarR family transcriptional regulator [Chloroflexota bacterium]|nr:MarR family transcriptional regulator [Chloroflexota bacterium]
MNESLDEAGLAAWEAFIFAHAAVVGRIERETSRADIVSLTWYDVLVALANAPQQRLRLNELAERVVLSRSGLTRLLDRIEKAGLIRREPAPGDRRGTFAVLTREGAWAQHQTWPYYAAGIARHFSQYLSEEEKRVLATALRRVREEAMKPPADQETGDDDP